MGFEGDQGRSWENPFHLAEKKFEIDRSAAQGHVIVAISAVIVQVNVAKMG